MGGSVLMVCMTNPTDPVLKIKCNMKYGEPSGARCAERFRNRQRCAERCGTVRNGARNGARNAESERGTIFFLLLCFFVCFELQSLSLHAQILNEWTLSFKYGFFIFFQT